MAEHNELKLVKNLEIVVDVFKKAAEKVARTGETEWRDVIEQQGYVLEEVLKHHAEGLKQVDNSTLKHSRVQSDLELALSDFTFCLNRALDSLVSQDQSQESARHLSDSDLINQVSEVILS
jgi:hypothetical protein